MKKYCEKYDAYFESKTGKWLEKECGDKLCVFCSQRPRKHKQHEWEFVGNIKGVCK